MKANALRDCFVPRNEETTKSFNPRILIYTKCGKIAMFSMYLCGLILFSSKSINPQILIQIKCSKIVVGDASLKHQKRAKFNVMVSLSNPDTIVREDDSSRSERMRGEK
jgi:hypothetical protein